MDIKNRGDTYYSMSTVFTLGMKTLSFFKRTVVLYSFFFGISLFILNGCVVSKNINPSLKTETILLKNFNKKNVKTFAVSLNFPIQKKGPFPVIISQHGSSRDGLVFKGGLGRTDEFTTRLIKKGTQMGFAVVAIDAFFSTNLEPKDKGKFPNAIKYAIQLKEFLSKQKRFQKKNIFYTGFSYGAGQVLKSFDIRTDYKGQFWRAIAAVEPGCNIVSQPVSVPFPLLIIKGTESHYYKEPCEFYAKLLRQKYNRVFFQLVEGGNHFFSSNGKIVDGIAVNGCRYNPVIRKPDGTFVFANGKRTTRKIFRKKCITNEAGSGKDRVYLDYVVQTVLNFFSKSMQLSL